MVINLNFRRRPHLPRFGLSGHPHETHAEADLIEVLTHCLICGRPLPWLSRLIGGTLCRRRECRLEYDQRQP